MRYATPIPRTTPWRAFALRTGLVALLLSLLLLTPAAAAQEGVSSSGGEDQVGGEEALGPPTRLSEVGAGSLLLKTAYAGVYRPAPVLDTEITVRVTGLVARGRVVQRFWNPTESWVEGIYVFPLPENGAVDTLEMIVGERRIVGEIREREEARRVYEEAKREGRKASLVEQERPNVFTNSVANLGPDEVVEVVLEYQQELRWDGDRFSLRLPLVVAPRYIPGTPLAAGESEDGGAIQGAAGSGWARDTAAVPDASRVTPPVRSPYGGPGNPVSVVVELEHGFPLAWVESPSHAVVARQLEDGRQRVELALGVEAANRDFVLEWAPAGTGAPRAALFTEELDGETYALLMVMPPSAGEEAAVRLPREVIFVLDVSGSMAGASIRQARQALLLALESLAPEDRFNVIFFSSHTLELHPAPVAATARALEEARRRVAAIDAGGGTEMLGALRAALLAGPRREEPAEAVRQVIFITDGSVGNEAELFAYIREHLGASRLFPVGIGSAPNGHFMRRAAEYGRGTYTFIGHPSEVGEKMGELFTKLESPQVADIEVLWEDPSAEVWPPRVPDLYRGEPVVVAARLIRPGDEVEISGWTADRPWETRLPIRGEFTRSGEAGIARLWARRKIAALLGQADTLGAQEARRAVVEVALAHHLVSPYTSLVAVDVTPTAPAGTPPDPRPVPVNLPAGWRFESVFGTLPRGATSARLDLLAGLLLLALSATALRLARRSRW